MLDRYKILSKFGINLYFIKDILFQKVIYYRQKPLQLLMSHRGDWIFLIPTFIHMLLHHNDHCLRVGDYPFANETIKSCGRILLKTRYNL